VGKLTNEADIFPTRADRMNGLLHICNNGFIVSNGAQNQYSPGVGAPMKLVFHAFGYMPMESVYNGGSPTTSMAKNYDMMSNRYTKFATDPATWDPAGVTLLARFNKWRKSTRVRAMTGPRLDPGRQHLCRVLWGDGGRWRIRTSDFHRVKVALYR
jgi:hypothetical protein